MSEETHAELESRASERMKSGASIMNQALVDLTEAAEENDLEKMKSATASVRDGLAQFESGVATQEALENGETPEQISLTWFKQNLGLQEEMDHDGQTGHLSFFGLGLFHFFVMLILSVFAIAMLAMYFFKMKRAAKLLERLSSTQGQAQALPPTSKKPWKGKLMVSSIYQETPTVKTFRLTMPDHSEGEREPVKNRLAEPQLYEQTHQGKQ